MLGEEGTLSAAVPPPEAPVAGSGEPTGFGGGRSAGDAAPGSDEPGIVGPPDPPPPRPPPRAYEARAAQPSPPAPQEPRSVLDRVTLAVMLITVGVIAILHNAGAIDAAARHYVGALVAVVGAGLVVAHPPSSVRS